MRIRQVRPEFFTDATMAALSPAVRLTYIGLWCVADDAGFLAWDVPALGAMLYPYESVRVRTRWIDAAGEALIRAGRLDLMDCGCARIPTLPANQRIGGTKSYVARDRHVERHKSGPVHTDMEQSAGRLGNGRVGEGRLEARTRDGSDEDRAERLAAFRRQGLPVPVDA